MKLRKLILGLGIIGSMAFVPTTINAFSKESEKTATYTVNPTIYISKGGGFDPANYWVVPGATVTWINTDQQSHTVTSNEGEFNSGDIAPGSSYSYTFTGKGPHSYYCSYHPEEAGTIHVVEK